uniref:Uncharacterized protein n=1 Tax=Lactuca sativa TaxID=4236 RepID=A0A9R1W2M6_LACSA|nr:hypothetical protein LSAT_V11C400202480 [Lactuca sativa]
MGHKKAVYQKLVLDIGEADYITYELIQKSEAVVVYSLGMCFRNYIKSHVILTLFCKNEQFVVVSDYTSPGGADYYTPKTNEDVKPKVQTRRRRMVLSPAGTYYVTEKESPTLVMLTLLIFNTKS